MKQSSAFFSKQKPTDWLLFLALLASALLAVWLPVDWTRNLKRAAQAPAYLWLNLGYCAVYTLASVWLCRKPDPETEARYRHKWLSLAVLIVLPNLFNVWLRYTAPLTATDPRPLFGRDADIGLFYEYGKSLLAGQWPTNPQGQFAEYPQLSFPLFWLGAVLTGSNGEAFYWIFPLLLVVFQIVAGFALYGVGLKTGQSRAAFLLTGWIAGCPALYLFSYTRFDIVPTALLLAGVFWALPNAKKQSLPSVSGLLVVVGALVKWLPGVAWPALAIGWWQTGKWQALARFGLASLIGGLLVTLPLVLINAPALLYPYKFQGSRKLIGESVWFLIQAAFLDPQHTVPDKPWGEPPRVLLSNNFLFIFQIGLVVLIYSLAIARLWRVTNHSTNFAQWLGVGLIAIAAFTLSNRIFSPQYLILLVWVWGACVVLHPVGQWGLITIFSLMSITTAMNFEVYLLGAYPDVWQRDSVILFTVGFFLSGLMYFRILK